jgi:hypothetical protein
MTDREQHEERFREAVAEQAEEARLKSEEAGRISHERSADDIDPRAKSTGHRKKTADKWNQ